jgi:tRNA(Ile)-lysidine synthase TilS/MesJ
MSTLVEEAKVTKRTKVPFPTKVEGGESSQHALILLSGGQDSCTALAWAVKRFNGVTAFTAKYGQRHIREIDCAKYWPTSMAVPTR